MRSLELPQIAARAELFRLRAMMRRQAIRVVLGAIAGMFVLVALGGANVAGALALADYVSPIRAVLLVVAVDIVLALILLMLAARDVPGPVEREALQVRRTAVTQAIETVVFVSLVRRLFRARSMNELSALAGTAVGTWLVGKRS
jgi:hypothetical protein